MRTDGRWRRLLAVPLLVGAVAGAGCGGSDDEGGRDGGDGEGDGEEQVEAARPPGFEASPAYLSAALEASTGTAYRFDATVTIGQRTDDGFSGIEDVPAMSGESDGEHTSTVTDPAAMIEAMGIDGMPAGVDPSDLIVEIVTEADVAYLYAPGYADLDLPGAADQVSLATLAVDLGDRWGRIDLAALGDDAGRLFSQLNQGQNLDPAFYLDLVRATDHVEELGGDIVDGTALIGLAADVPMTSLLEAQGIDPAVLTAGAPNAEIAEAVSTMTMAVEVWLDGQGMLRRLTMDLGAGLATLAEDYDFEGEEQVTGVEMVTDISFSDHGDGSIAVEVPAEADTVDITETVRRLDTGA